jgi:hypothetical protein
MTFDLDAQKSISLTSMVLPRLVTLTVRPRQDPIALRSDAQAAAYMS